MTSIEVYAFICKGIAGAPPDVYGLHVTHNQADQPRPLETWAKQTYWALSADEAGGYPPVLMHIYFEGDLPSDRERDYYNRSVRAFTGKLLFNQDV